MNKKINKETKNNLRKVILLIFQSIILAYAIIGLVYLLESFVGLMEKNLILKISVITVSVIFIAKEIIKNIKAN